MTSNETVMRCEDCPDREFDNPGSARGHANRLGHHLIGVSLALVVKEGRPQPLTGAVRAELEALAGVIRLNVELGQKAVGRAWEARFVIGQQMARARELLRSDLEFGRWIKEQEFGFGGTRAKQFLILGQHEAEARNLLDTMVSRSDEVGWRPVLKAIAPPKVVRPVTAEEIEAVSDDGWEFRRIHRLLRSDTLYDVMSIPTDAAGLSAIPDQEKEWVRSEFKRIAEHLAALYQAIGNE